MACLVYSDNSGRQQLSLVEAMVVLPVDGP